MSTTGSGYGHRRSALEDGVVVATDYRIDGLLGDGGMGVVYEATQLSLDRKVALKLVASELSEDFGFRERFRREGRIQAQIDHPHIIEVYGAGESPYGLFLAMRLVRGPTLKELIVGGSLETGRAVRFLTQIASALDAAHGVELVHRDIKPHNVLIDERREHSYLADFGVTKARGGDTGLTRAGQLVGTLDYMAPEQFRGQEATERSDLYAFGAVVYEALVGTVPFPRPTEGAVMYAHLSDPVPSVLDRRPSIPKEVDKIIAKAMAKKPEDRFGSASEMMVELTEILATVRDEVLTEPPPAPPSADTSVGTRAGETAARAEETVHSGPGAGSTQAPGRERTVVPITPPTAPSPRPSATRLSEGAHLEQELEEQRPTEPRRTDDPGTRMSTTPVPAGDGPGTLISRSAKPDKPPSEPQPAGRRRVVGRSRKSLIYAGLLGTAVLATIGFFVGHAQTGRQTTASPQPTQRVLRSGPITLSVPVGWKPTSAHPIPGLKLSQSVGASPTGGARNGVVAGHVSPAWPSFLPRDFRKLIGSGVLSKQEVVRLGGLSAFRYASLDTRGIRTVIVTIYAVPQPGQATVVACYAGARTDPALRTCDSIAASLKLNGARDYPLAASRPYARKLNVAVTDLKADRLRGLRSITAAKSQSAEAGAAGTIAAAYRRAVQRVRAASPTAFVQPAHRRVTAAMTRIANAYAALAKAAKAGNHSRYDELRRIVRTREAQLAQELSYLRLLGFRS
jgi:serine/threonine-protein kinase